MLKEQGHIEAQAVHQRVAFEAGVRFARAEGILPAPEPNHAIKVAIDQAMEAKAEGRSRVILFNLCGHGHFDLSAYERHLAGTLEDYEYPAERIAEALDALKALPVA
jgi:tryptophan synthase beta chain